MPHKSGNDVDRRSGASKPRGVGMTEAVHREARSDARLVSVLCELAAQVLPEPFRTASSGHYDGIMTDMPFTRRPVGFCGGFHSLQKQLGANR